MYICLGMGFTEGFAHFVYMYTCICVKWATPSVTLIPHNKHTYNTCIYVHIIICIFRGIHICVYTFWQSEYSWKDICAYMLECSPQWSYRLYTGCRARTHSMLQPLWSRSCVPSLVYGLVVEGSVAYMYMYTYHIYLIGRFASWAMSRTSADALEWRAIRYDMTISHVWYRRVHRYLTRPCDGCALCILSQHDYTYICICGYVYGWRGALIRVCMHGYIYIHVYIYI